MKLQQRTRLLNQLGQYILSQDTAWLSAMQKAEHENGWFIPEFVQHAAQQIAHEFLDEAVLAQWAARYELSEENEQVKKIGVTMAGNIPMAGFHDLASIFISGHRAVIKPSSKDDALIRHLTQKLSEWGAEDYFLFPGMLKNCDAYIATGSNNSSRYFEYYFGKYPHIIRRNRTSAAILDGTESNDDLEKLADDVFLYFGLGCRNVTSVAVPGGYDFIPLLAAFKKYGWLMQNHKYRNNYDYNLAILLLNKTQYMTNGSVLLNPSDLLFSPVSQLNFNYYEDYETARQALKSHPDLQCLVGKRDVAFGTAQSPGIADYADGVDTMRFLKEL
jgi:hypothetical protein